MTARVCKGLSPEIAARLEGVVYQGVICATVVLDRPLSVNYLTYLTEADLPFTAIVETSALTGTRAIRRPAPRLPSAIRHAGGSLLGSR